MKLSIWFWGNLFHILKNRISMNQKVNESFGLPEMHRPIVWKIRLTGFKLGHQVPHSVRCIFLYQTYLSTSSCISSSIIMHSNKGADNKCSIRCKSSRYIVWLHFWTPNCHSEYYIAPYVSLCLFHRRTCCWSHTFTLSYLYCNISLINMIFF